MKKLLIPSLLAAAAVSANGALIGYWNFNNNDLDESSGFKPDGTHDGVAVGSVAYTAGPTPPGAGFGRALDLTAGSSAVKILNSNARVNGSAGGSTNGSYQNTFDGAIAGGPMSIALWVQGTPGNWEPFVSIKGESHGYQLRKHGGGAAGTTFTLRGTGGADDPGGALSINDNTWHHVAGVWDKANGNRLLYVDGVLDTAGSITNGSDTGNVAAATWEYLVFGARDWQGSIGWFSDVKLDEIRIYNEALSQTEVQALMVPEPGANAITALVGLVLVFRRRRK